MKAKLLKILIVLYCFGATDFHEWMKIPFLFNHYIEHKQENADLNFENFISLHYQKGARAQSSHEHGQLPFNDDENCAVVLTGVWIDYPTVQKIESPMLYLSLNSNPTNDDFCILSYSNDIWQPPRIS